MTDAVHPNLPHIGRVVCSCGETITRCWCRDETPIETQPHPACQRDEGGGLDWRCIRCKRMIPSGSKGYDVIHVGTIHSWVGGVSLAYHNACYPDGLPLEFGGDQTFVLDKMYGPRIFASLRVVADLETTEWKIERQWISSSEYKPWATIPGQIAEEFTDREDDE